MMNSEFLRQHQLAECALTRAACFSANAGSRSLNRTSKSTQERDALEVEPPTEHKPGSGFAVMRQIFYMR
jgi:hypothetical protein